MRRYILIVLFLVPSKISSSGKSLYECSYTKKLAISHYLTFLSVRELYIFIDIVWLLYNFCQKSQKCICFSIGQCSSLYYFKVRLQDFQLAPFEYSKSDMNYKYLSTLCSIEILKLVPFRYDFGVGTDQNTLYESSACDCKVLRATK